LRNANRAIRTHCTGLHVSRRNLWRLCSYITSSPSTQHRRRLFYVRLSRLGDWASGPSKTATDKFFQQ